MPCEAARCHHALAEFLPAEGNYVAVKSLEDGSDLFVHHVWQHPHNKVIAEDGGLLFGAEVFEVAFIPTRVQAAQRILACDEVQ